MKKKAKTMENKQLNTEQYEEQLKNAYDVLCKQYTECPQEELRIALILIEREIDSVRLVREYRLDIT